MPAGEYLLEVRSEEIPARMLEPGVKELASRLFEELMAFFRGTFPRIHAVPGDGQMPEIWLLGSSDFSARMAGELGLPFSFAHHFMPQNTEPALEIAGTLELQAGAIGGDLDPEHHAKDDEQDEQYRRHTQGAAFRFRNGLQEVSGEIRQHA